MGNQYISLRIKWPKNNDQWVYHYIEIPPITPRPLCVIRMLVHNLRVLKEKGVDLNRYPFLFPVVNQYGHLVPLTDTLYRKYNVKCFDFLNWQWMSVHDRRRGAATAGYLAKLSDNQVAFLMRHSRKSGSVTKRYMLLPRGSKYQFPRILAKEAYTELKKFISGNLEAHTYFRQVCKNHFLIAY